MINIGIIGATGYTGVELIRLLQNHQQANLTVITSDSESGKMLSEVFPSLRNKNELQFQNHDSSAVADCDLVFFATPHATSMYKIPELLKSGVKIIDLSADYRLSNPDIWQDWYGIAHASPDLLAEAVYGLPELNREQIKQANLIANPGCYPTASTLALIPALQSNLIDPDSIIIDAKSGYSGAGRKASQAGLFSEVSETFKAYGLSGHRHLPEISQTLNAVSSAAVDVTFVPHLLPINRGILATIYTEQTKQADIQQCYSEYYQDEPYVDILEPGSMPDTRSARGSNVCRIALHPSPGKGRLVIVSVIDNLVKGAAGQAIQNMNIVFGFDEQMGLEQSGFYP